jgi:hypothetical protein
MSKEIIEKNTENMKVIFSKRWEKYDNAHLKDKTKDVIVEAKIFDDTITALKIDVNGSITYIYAIFSLAYIRNKFKNVKTLAQFKKVISDLITYE